MLPQRSCPRSKETESRNATGSSDVILKKKLVTTTFATLGISLTTDILTRLYRIKSVEIARHLNRDAPMVSRLCASYEAVRDLRTERKLAEAVNK
jgi:hypothetical protein